MFDSTRWGDYRPRPDDIIIATYSKCGTTWMQRIVSMLIFRSSEPVPLWVLSPWPDMRWFGPIEGTWATAEAQDHRRFFKSHLPYDALPVAPGVKVIHVARDGRDAAMSLHNHLLHFTPEVLAVADEISVADPKFGDPYPRVPADPAEFFHLWIADEEYDGQGDPAVSFFQTESSFWAARHEPHLLLVHYADLKRDLAGEMRRIAEFLEIEVAEDRWAELVEAARFETMKTQGAALIPAAEGLWSGGGSQRFFHKGQNGRWRGILAPGDLAAYDEKVRTTFPPDLASWIEHGRLASAEMSSGGGKPGL